MVIQTIPLENILAKNKIKVRGSSFFCPKCSGDEFWLGRTGDKVEIYCSQCQDFYKEEEAQDVQWDKRFHMRLNLKSKKEV